MSTPMQDPLSIERRSTPHHDALAKQLQITANLRRELDKERLLRKTMQRALERLSSEFRAVQSAVDEASEA